MGLDHRPADRQPQTYPTGPGSKKWLEDTFYVPWLDAGSGILNLDEHLSIRPERSNDKFPLSNGYPAHRFDAVCDHIDQYLLQLYSVSRDQREVCGQVQPDGDMVPADFVARDLESIPDELIDHEPMDGELLAIQLAALVSSLHQQRPDP